jgi:hypothetical protein
MGLILIMIPIIAFHVFQDVQYVMDQQWIIAAPAELHTLFMKLLALHIVQLGLSETLEQIFAIIATPIV